MGVYEPVPVPSMTSQPLTVSSGPVPSHFSLRLAPSQVLPAVTLPPVTYAVPGASGAVGSVSVPPVTSAPFTAPNMMLPGPPMPFPFTKEFHFTAPRSPQSPHPPSPILQERRSLAQRASGGKLQDMAADVEKLSQGGDVLVLGSGRKLCLQILHALVLIHIQLGYGYISWFNQNVFFVFFGIVKETSLEAAGQAQLRSEFEALKQTARSQSESVEQLKGQMDPTGPTRVWTPRKPFGHLKSTAGWPKSDLFGLTGHSLFGVIEFWVT